MSTTEEADIFSIMGKLDVSIGNLGDEVAKMRQRQDRWRSMQETPKYMRIHSSLALSAGGFGVYKFDNDGPDLGRMWYLRKLTVAGVTPSTTVAGRADLFVSSMDYRQFTTLAAMGTQDWLDQATTLPLVGTYSPGEIPLQHMEQLFVVVSGGTGSQELHMSGIIEDFQTGAYKMDWAL